MILTTPPQPKWVEPCYKPGIKLMQANLNLLEEVYGFVNQTAIKAAAKPFNLVREVRIIK